MSRIVVADRLAPSAYRPFGEVIEAPPHGGRLANFGTATRFDRLAPIENHRAQASPNLSVFRCSPHPSSVASGGGFTVDVRVLERHLHSTQLFVPMMGLAGVRFLVVVALGGERPDPSSIVAFIGGPGQGITYRPGVWHHPMIALYDTVDFASLVFEDNSSADCEVVNLPDEQRAAVRRFAP